MAAFEADRAELDATGVAIVAASTDDEAHAATTVADLGLSFPVGHGLPLEDTAARLGAYYEPRRGILNATGFVLRPGGAIALAAYSSGPIGRLVAPDVLAAIRFWQQLLAPPAG